MLTYSEVHFLVSDTRNSTWHLAATQWLLAVNRVKELAASEFKVPEEIKVWLKKQKQQMADAAVYDLIRDYENVQVEKINKDLLQGV